MMALGTLIIWVRPEVYMVATSRDKPERLLWPPVTELHLQCLQTWGVNYQTQRCVQVE